MILKADKLRQKDGIRRKRTIPIGYLVKNHDLPYAHLVVHLVPGSKTDWVVSERFTGARIVKESSQSKDIAVRAAITKIKSIGRAAYEKATANYK